jgi:hypothetical protein
MLRLQRIFHPVDGDVPDIFDDHPGGVSLVRTRKHPKDAVPRLLLSGEQMMPEQLAVPGPGFHPGLDIDCHRPAFQRHHGGGPVRQPGRQRDVVAAQPVRPPLRLKREPGVLAGEPGADAVGGKAAQVTGGETPQAERAGAVFLERAGGDQPVEQVVQPPVIFEPEQAVDGRKVAPFFAAQEPENGRDFSRCRAARSSLFLINIFWPLSEHCLAPSSRTQVCADVMLRECAPNNLRSRADRYAG